MYASAILSETNDLENCMGFIDGTFLAITRPGDYQVQEIAYSGHKKKHAVKHQAATTPDGLVLHCVGSIEERRHNWTLYVRSGIEGNLEETLSEDGAQYHIRGDSGSAPRLYLKLPFQGSLLTV